MFKLVSQTVWYFAQPSSLIIVLLLVGVLLIRRSPSVSAWLIRIAVVCLLAMAVLPLGSLLLSPLENRFPMRQVEEMTSPPHGIIVLGGAEQPGIIADRQTLAVNHNAERLIEGVRLARRFPTARIIVTEGTALEHFATMGIARERLTLERKSSTTFENAIYSVELANPATDQVWLLVTSAYHMPRAVGSFRKTGFKVTAWPVDYRTPRRIRWWRIPHQPSKGISDVDLATKEWVGMLVYWLTGRMNELFPAPQ